jgi:hypothetical protein
MRTKRFLAYGLVVFALVASSCSKDEETTTEDKYSTLSIEENKANIENDGVKMVSELEALEEEPAVETSKSLISFLDKGDKKMAKLTNSVAFKSIYATANISNGNDLFKSVEMDSVDLSISEGYNEFVGTWDWDNANQKWNKTEGGSVIVFNFPSTETGTVNDASYKISYEGKVGQVFDYNGDLPEKITAVLTVKLKEVLSYNLVIDYGTDNVPTKEEMTFKIGSYKIYSLASNKNNANFKVEESFTHGSTVLLKFTFDAAGDWSVDNLENLSEEGDISKVVTKGNTSLQVMNVKIVGAVNVSSFVKNQKENMTIDEQISLINNNVTLNVRYANSNEIIAKAEAYTIDGELDARFVFADGSKESVEKYFSRGFDKMINRIAQYSTHIEDVYGIQE